MTMKSLFAAALLCASLASPTLANDYIEFPVEGQAQAIPRSHRTGQLVVNPPYRHAFQVRVYTTSQQPPYYNVPPYPVITPY